MISFYCDDCGRKIKVSPAHAGKKGKCPNCRAVVVVPPEQTTAPIELEHNKLPSVPLVRFSCVMCSQSMTAPESKRGEIVACPNCGSFAEVPVKETLANEPEVTYETEEIPEEEYFDYARKSIQPDEGYSGKRKLPWFLDIFLYPVSDSGLINLGIFVGVPLTISLVGRFLMPMLCFFLVIRFVVGLYFCWYIAECVRDSGMGGIRAPSVLSSGGDDLGGLIGAWANLVACYLVCFFPALLYNAITDQQNFIYWSLLGYSALLFPLLFLSVVIIDSVSAWNPITLIVAFVKLQPQYLIASAGFFAIIFGLHFLPKADNVALSLLAPPVAVYAIFIGAHLLGRFYWLNSEKLDW